jgi:ABC-type oligopeptide transport system substrate-binding subunit
MQRLLADDLPVLPLFYPEVDVLFRKDVLDQWYFTPGQFPSESDNKQLFITGLKAGSSIRS